MKPLDFLTELYLRLQAKSPKFFQHLQTFGVILAFVTGIPELLKELHTEYQIDVWTMLPSVVQVFASKTFFVCGVVIKMLAKLPVIEATPAQVESDKVKTAVLPDGKAIIVK